MFFLCQVMDASKSTRMYYKKKAAAGTRYVHVNAGKTIVMTSQSIAVLTKVLTWEGNLYF